MLRHVTFDGLPLLASYSAGMRLPEEDGVAMIVRMYPFSSMARAFATVRAAKRAGGTGNELELGYAMLDFNPGASSRRISLQFHEGARGHDGVIEVNGKPLVFTGFATLNGVVLGGANLSVVSNSPAQGELVVESEQGVRSFAIGGVELSIDDVTLTLLK